MLSDAAVPRTVTKPCPMCCAIAMLGILGPRALIDHLDQRVERLRRGFGASWRPIVSSSYRRRLGRAVARL